MSINDPEEKYSDVVTDKRGTVRYRGNRIVEDLLDSARGGRRLDLNDIAALHQIGKYSLREMVELYKLINYSLSGFEEIFSEELDREEEELGE